jgi:hypothetical protein
MYFNVKDENAIITLEYCGIFAQSKNCEARETAVARERL